MSVLKKNCAKLSVVIGASVVGALAPVGSINATENPFASSQLAGGYMMAAEDMKKRQGG